MNMKKAITVSFILFFIIGGLLFWISVDKISGDCSRNKGSLITIGGDKVYCDHEGRMWSYTLPSDYKRNQAIDICQDLVYAKTKEWELPDIAALEDLYNENYFYVVCNNREFPGDFNSKNNWDSNICHPSNSAGHYYWSSSKLGNQIWGIFGYDSSPTLFQQDLDLSVRCVEKASIVEVYDKNACDEMQNQKRKDSCYLKVAESGQDFSICELIQDPKRKDSCYSRVAQFKQDSSICDKVQDKSLKNYCYSGVAALKQDPSICDNIDGQEKVRIPYHSIKDNCYQYIAISKQDPSICDKIQEQNFKDWDCYSHIKLDLLSIEQGLAICDKIQDQGSKNSCYTRVATYGKDKSICDKIQNDGEFTINGSTEKEWCYKKANGSMIQTTVTTIMDYSITTTTKAQGDQSSDFSINANNIIKENPKVGDIIKNPKLYEKKEVIINGKYGDPSDELENCDLERTGSVNSLDALVYDETGCLYMTAGVKFLYNEKPVGSLYDNYDFNITVKGMILLINGKPYIGK